MVDDTLETKVRPTSASWWRRLVVWYAGSLVAVPLLTGLMAAGDYLVQGLTGGDANGVELNWRELLMTTTFTPVHTVLPLVMLFVPYAGIFAVMGWACVRWPRVDWSYQALAVVAVIAATPVVVVARLVNAHWAACLAVGCIGALAIWLPRRCIPVLGRGAFAGPPRAASRTTD